MDALSPDGKKISFDNITNKGSVLSIKGTPICKISKDDFSKDSMSERVSRDPKSGETSKSYCTKVCKRFKKKKKKGIACKVCNRQFRDNHNLNRHFDTKHGKTYTCSFCPVFYNTERKLQRHLKKHQRLKGFNTFKCPTCLREFRDKNNMKLHRCSKTYKKSVCIYPECGEEFYHVTKMLNHVEKEHDSKVDSATLTFESEALFQRWKEEEELASFAYFSKRSGTVDLDFGSYRYYVCQANGENISGPRKTSKRWKKGLVRLGKLCPSRMLVKEVDGKINVKYISLHSHDRSSNNDKLPIPKSVETYAKNLLSMGASPQQVRKNVSDGTFEGNKLIPQGGYVISNRYFFDLKKRLESKSTMTVRETDRYDPVFVYKPQGESVVIGDSELDRLPCSNDLFAIGIQTKEQCIMMKKRAHKIVCIMSAETQRYLDFEIITLIVPDVFGNGYPVAHLLTSHIDEVTLRLLFLCLRKRFPTLKIKYVMTDDDVSVFNAFSFAFGNHRHLLCQWYVKTCWEDQIGKIYSDKNELYRFLRAILYEHSKSTFKILCNNFVEKFTQQYPDFVKYFASNFLTCPEEWAMSYRHCSKSVSNPWPYTNINMHCEYFQSKLKEFIANENESKMVADVAFLLLEIQKGHFLHYKEHLLKGKRVRSATKGKHHNGLLIPDENISYSCGLWYVKSPFNNTFKYTVTMVNNNCINEDCYEKCEESLCEGLCSHLYRCSCDDRDDLCGHIHKVHSWKVQQEMLSTKLTSEFKPKHLEFIYSEVLEDLEDSKFTYITVVKKEMDAFHSSDVDFVHINVNEDNEPTVVFQKRLSSCNERQSSEQPQKTHSLLKDNSWNNDYASYRTEDNSNQHLKTTNIRHSETVMHTHFVKTEGCENVQEAVIKNEQIDNNEHGVRSRSSSYNITYKETGPSMKDLNSCATEADDLEKILPVRGKRPRTRSIVQAAIDNKRKRLEAQSETLESRAKDLSNEETVSDIFHIKNLKCKYCSRVFGDEYNLKRHILSKHLQCKYCSKSFRSKYSLEKHIQVKHSVSVSYTCELCALTFETKVDFDKHAKKHRCSRSVQCPKCLRSFRDYFNMKQHQCGKTNKKSSCIYPGCEMQFYHMTQMVKHLEQDHDDKIDTNSLYFESEKMFQAWKEQEEAQSLAVFNKRNGTLGSDHVRYSYYICQAGGDSICTTKTSRRWKNKIRTGKPCPSRMLVKEKDGKITVKYISYHSHDVKDDKRSPPLPKYVKELGKQLLLMGVSPRRVRESVQDGVLINDSHDAQKSFSVRSRYFYDMKKRLERKGCIFPSEKEMSIPDRKPKDFMEIIASGKYKSFNPVLVYKAQEQSVMVGEEGLDSLPFSSQLFAFGMQSKQQNEIMNEGANKVVCIRPYFDISEDGFQLYNFVVPDKYGNGYPVAHFITSHTDELTLSLLFMSLRKRCPKLHIPVLITDDDSDVYNAVHKVFGGDIHHFLCHWYVKTSWLQKSNQLVHNMDHKVDIPLHLMNLLYEQDETKFQSLCRIFVNKYQSSCRNFCGYFMEYFVKRPEMWALCYRQNVYSTIYSELFTNVNLHCEYLYNHLETMTFSGSFYQRVVKLTELLMRTDREYSLLYRKNTHLSIPVNSSIKGRHFSGLQIDDRNVFNYEDTWTVTSRFDSNVKYTVSIMERNCNRVNCHEECMELLCVDLCNHLYFCSCEDRADLCEHIHKVHSLRSRLGNLYNMETFTDDLTSSIQVVVSDPLPEDPALEVFTVKVEPFSELDPLDDKIVCHEIYELEM